MLILLDNQTSTAVTEILFIIPAIGIGPLFQLPLLALQAAMPLKFMCVDRTSARSDRAGHKRLPRSASFD